VVVWGYLWRRFEREMGLVVGKSDSDGREGGLAATNGAAKRDDLMEIDEALPETRPNHSTFQHGKTQTNNKKNNAAPKKTAAEQYIEAKKSAILRKRCRIRSFCWSQVPRDISNLPGGLKNQAIQECTNHLLIVTNDYEEVIVLHVRSPYDDPLSPSDWNVKIVAVIDTRGPNVQDPAGPQLFSLKRGLHSITINEWTTEQGKEELWTAFIAYGKDHSLEVMRCTISYVKDEMVLKADRNHLLTIPEYDVVGPMCWAPEV